MDLCTLQGVKLLIEIDADNTDTDQVLNSLIRSVSRRAENYMNRAVKTEALTEYFNIRPGDYMFSLKGFPVSSTPAIEVYHDIDSAFGTGTDLDSDAYTVDTEAGLLYVEGGYLTSGFRALKVVYTGGMATNTNELMASHEDLIHAVERQVAFQFKTRTKIGAQSVNTNTGSVTWESGVVWLKEVKAVLDSYRRHSVP